MDINSKKKLANGVEIPVLGFGVYLSPEGEVTASSVRWAVESGYRHIDAAAIYGNERRESVPAVCPESSCLLPPSCGTTIYARAAVRRPSRKR